MKSAEIRQKFLDFFAQQGHHIIPSSSLIPVNDPTLLFTNAGMNQFKDIFLGLDQRAYSRAASSQKCVRAGGKHNDLENVGYTARHHTFFEMLGNFSFGDYFKRDAILYAWEFLTSEAWLHLPKDKLWITVYAEDDEAYKIWHQEVGLAKERIIRIGDNKGTRYASDNFWAMGDTGPCGPCTEIFYDHGTSILGGLPGTPDQEGDRYVEIWNNVFMQFNRDSNGILHLLPRPSVDTGMGLERISAIMQGVHSNYDTDLFQHLINTTQKLTGTLDRSNPSLRVIADHIRSCAFLIADGIVPSNEGRGYVLRRIIRRAIRHGNRLGQKKPFFHKLIIPLLDTMGEAYPELIQNQTRIEDLLKQEEVAFGHTLENGLIMLASVLSQEGKVLDGSTAFKLADTFGFPVDLTADICRERGVTVDMDGFEAALANQKAHSKSAEKFHRSAGLAYEGPVSIFHGDKTLSCEASILALYKDKQPINELCAGEEGIVVLDHTPFYAESGGQVGDLGYLCALVAEVTDSRNPDILFKVTDTQKIKVNVFGHQGYVVHSHLKVGDRVQAVVDLPRRLATARHHSATHLLHAVLRRLLGLHVEQKGSLVTAERLRFDFSHPKALDFESVCDIESEVNREIMRNIPVIIENKSYHEAIQSGALALFGEKYDHQVRVIQMGDCSIELCGGTHVCHTGEIGFFKIISETGIAAGIRRIEAITGQGALQQVHKEEREIQQAYELLQSQPGNLLAKLKRLQDREKSLEKECSRLKVQLASYQSDALLRQVVEVKGIKVLTAQLDHADPTCLRETLDYLKSKLNTAVIVLGTVQEDKVMLVAGATANMTSKIRAGDLVSFVANQVGGKGGGRADFAQAGGTQPGHLPAALASVSTWIGSLIDKQTKK